MSFRPMQFQPFNTFNRLPFRTCAISAASNFNKSKIFEVIEEQLTVTEKLSISDALPKKRNV